MKAQKTNAEHQTQSLSEVLPDIGDEIRKVLARKHLSGAWLAVRIGCDRTNIYKILRKKIPMICMFFMFCYIRFRYCLRFSFNKRRAKNVLSLRRSAAPCRTAKVAVPCGFVPELNVVAENSSNDLFLLQINVDLLILRICNVLNKR